MKKLPKMLLRLTFEPFLLPLCLRFYDNLCI